MKESPIIFSTEMVQAILAGRKTQTRRILKNIPRLSDSINQTAKFLNKDKELRENKSPFGKPGDLIWVRETFLKPPFITQKMLKDGADTWPKFDYVSSSDSEEIEQYKQWGWKTKPSIHMPKVAARIWLKVKKIRIERLHDISEEDAILEGIKWLQRTNLCHMDYTIGEYVAPFSPKASFKTLWQSIHDRLDSDNAWKKNPWVWVIDFEVLSTTGKPSKHSKNRQLELNI